MRVLDFMTAVAFVCMGVSCSSECCTDHATTYHLSGPRPSQAGSCATVIADFYEGTSSRCTSGCSAQSSVPGDVALEQSLGTSSTWSVDVPVSYAAAQPPAIDAYVYCDTNRNGHIDIGDACIGSTSLTAGSHDGVELARSDCPGRL